ncbi:hypothetical protein ABLE92_04890 [Gordonia sp. VNQ95]|uniref:hypothetical protein n=1 Tax=Gordonia TaxID=2053 RepID=UPI0032B4B2D9
MAVAMTVTLGGCAVAISGSPVAADEPELPLDLRDPAVTADVRDFEALDPCAFVDVAAVADIVGAQPYDVGLTSELTDCELRFDEATARISDLRVSPTPFHLLGFGTFTPLPMDGVEEASIDGGPALYRGSDCSISVNHDRDLGVFFFASHPSGRDPMGVCDALTEIARASVPLARHHRSRAESPYPVTSRLIGIDACGAARLLRPRHPRLQIRDGQWWSSCRMDLESVDNLDHGVFVDAILMNEPMPPASGVSNISDITVRGFRGELRDDGEIGCKGFVFVGMDHKVVRRTISYGEPLFEPGRIRRYERTETLVEAYQTYSSSCDLTVEILDAAARAYLAS